jgi:hypothetical protein
VKGDQREEWLELCAQAADEQDPQKLLGLVTRINDLLEAKEARLQQRTSTRDTAPGKNTSDQESTTPCNRLSRAKRAEV